MAPNVRRRLDIPHGLSNLLRYVNVLLPSSGAEADTRAVLPENQASTLFQVVESPAPCLCFAARNVEVVLPWRVHECGAQLPLCYLVRSMPLFQGS